MCLNKTIIFLLSSLFGVALVKGNIQNKDNPDKPTRTFVGKNIVNWNANSVGQDYNAPLDETVTWDEPSVYSQNWADGIGGEGHWSNRDHVENSLYGGHNYFCTASFNWPASYWPTLANPVQTASGDCNWEVIDPVQTNPPPAILFEYCSISKNDTALWTNVIDYIFGGDWSGTDTYTYHRNARTEIKLFTGGKNGIRKSSLFGASAGATELRERKPGVHQAYLTDSFTVAPTKITVSSFGELDENAKAYRALPDGQTLNITPRTSKNYYTFSVEAQKYKSYLDIYVAQANPGYSFLPYGPNYVGHTFWKFTTDAPNDALQHIRANLTNYLGRTVGFFPDVDLCASHPGLTQFDGANGEANIHRKFYIGFSDLISGLEYTRSMDKATPAYCVTGLNCTVAAHHAGFYSGISLPWDESPQNFGVTLVVKMYPGPFWSDDLY